MRSSVAAIALAALLAAPASADDVGAVIAAYAGICPAALLAPDTLPAVLDGLGFTQRMTLPLGTTRTDGYATADNALAVSVTTRTFSDAVHRYCVVPSFEPLGFDGMVAARAALEANALVGPLEGRILPMGVLVSAYLKRPGTTPIVAANLTSTRESATLTLESWTPIGAN